MFVWLLERSNHSPVNAASAAEQEEPMEEQYEEQREAYDSVWSTIRIVRTCAIVLVVIGCGFGFVLSLAVTALAEILR